MPFPSLGYPESIELVPLAKATYPTPGQTSAAVRELTAAGVPAGSAHGEVYAPEAFALAWAKVIGGYRTTPLRGARLRRAAERSRDAWRAAAE